MHHVTSVAAARCPVPGGVLQEVGKSRKPVKRLVALACVVMVLYCTGTRETASPGSSWSIAEPEVMRKPSEVSHTVAGLCWFFINFRHT